MASKVPGSAGVLEIFKNDRVFEVDSRMAVTCSSSAVVKSTGL